MTHLEIFEEYLRQPTPDARREFAFANPIVFSAALLNAIDAQVSAESRPGERRGGWCDRIRRLFARGDRTPETEGDRQEAVLALHAARQHFLDAPDDYPVGDGPVERLIAPFKVGEIDLAELLRRAPSVAEQLSLVYVLALGRDALHGADDPDQREWILARQQVVLAGAEAMPDGGDKDVVLAWARRYWIEIAKIVLATVPDGRIFSSAKSAAEGLLVRAKRLAIPDAIGDAEYYAGTLYLDTYTQGRLVSGFPAQIRAWWRRLADRVGDAEAARIQESHPMPTVEEALATATAHLRESARHHSDGRPRAGAQKALVQALYFTSEGLGGAIDRDELYAAASAALHVLDPDEAGALDLVAMLESLGLDPPEHTQAPLPRAKRRTSAADIAFHTLSVATRLQKTDPKKAFDTLANATESFAHVDASLQHNRRMVLLQLFKALHTSPELQSLVHGGVPACAERVRAAAATQRWSTEKLAAVLLTLAIEATAIDGERDALQVVETAAKISPDFIRQHAEIVQFLIASLHAGEAANAANGGRPVDAIAAYTESIPRFMALASTHEALKSLERIVWLVTDEGEAIGDSVVPHLARLALNVETHLGDRATELLQRAYQISLPVKDDYNVESIAALLSLAKGYEWSTLLKSRERYNPLSDSRVTALLSTISALEDRSDLSLTSEASDGLSAVQREVILVSYLARATPMAGSSAEQRLQNVRFQVDQQIAEQMVGASDSAAQSLHLDHALRGSLDEESVLLDVFLYSGVRGAPACFVRVMSKEAETVIVLAENGAPAGESVQIDLAGRSVAAQPIAPLVAVLRNAIQEDPDDERVGESNRLSENYILQLSAGILSPTVVKTLDVMRARGKTHLAVCAHGPLHFVPFQALVAGNRRLADHWLVTQTPNLALFERRSRQRAHRRTGAAVFGVSFAGTNRYGLAEIPGALEEARDIARVVGTAARCDGEATKDGVIDALRTQRWVHIATHGSQEVDASAFHCLFLGNNERVHAYEILPETLQGLEVVTLSACESGLGRVDAGDNLRGLPAALLYAGCEAIVGSLWAVDDDVAREFFTSFYAALLPNKSVRTAFREAQVAIRAHRPGLRDWAAFYLIEA